MPNFTITLRKAEEMDAMGIEVPAKVVEGFGQGAWHGLDLTCPPPWQSWPPSTDPPT